MAKRAIHRMLELSIGIPFLLFGGYCVILDVGAYRWIMEDPDHRRAVLGFWTLIGILPLLAGCCLLVTSIIRMRQKG